MRTRAESVVEIVDGCNSGPSGSIVSAIAGYVHKKNFPDKGSSNQQLLQVVMGLMMDVGHNCRGDEGVLSLVVTYMYDPSDGYPVPDVAIGYPS